MENINLENAILYADSARGVYIPQYFAESIKRECVSGFEQTSPIYFAPTPWDILCSGPYGEYIDEYWDTWTHVLDNAIVTDPSTGIEYGLWQDGDLWLVPLADLYAVED